MSACENCNDTGEVQVLVDKDVQTENGPKAVQYYKDEPCQECCEHAEHDHGICLDCGKDNYEDMAAMAYDHAKDSWKDGY